MLRAKLSFRCLCGWLLATASVLVADEGDYLSEDELFFEEDIVEVVEVYDPLEPINRVVFSFNDVVNGYVFTPLAKGYDYVVPDPVQAGGRHFFQNMRYPIRLVGNLLQLKLKGAWVETQRFAINTTLGIAGVMDVAKNFDGLEGQPIGRGEDVAQAFAAWGIPAGPYLVVPFLGPLNAREGVGLIGSFYVDPWTQPINLLGEWELRTAYVAGTFIVEGPTLMNAYNGAVENAVDPYSAVKNGYTQFQRSLVAE